MSVIKRLKIKNAGVHRNRTFDFTEGFNIIRGPNEGGKSTILECIAICFFGASAMRGGWEDIVTLDEKVSTMKLELQFGEYLIKRSKSSASVVGPDTKIAGHNDVTNFFLDMFGIKKGTEKHVMIAEQSAVKGILESGAAAATNFIEDLAGFDQIDQLIERMKVTFPAESKKVIEEQIDALDVKLLEKREDKAALPRVAELEMKVVEVQEIVDEHLEEVTEIGESVKTIEAAINKVKVENVQRIAAQKRYDKAVDVDELIQENLATLEEAIVTFNPEPTNEVTAAEKFLGNVAEASRLHGFYSWVLRSPKYEQFWDESVEELEDTVVSTASQVDELEKKIKDLEIAKATLKSTPHTSDDLEAAVEEKQQRMVGMHQLRAKLIEDDICPTCKTDLSDPEHRAECAKNNAEINRQIIVATTDIDKLGEIVRTEKEAVIVATDAKIKKIGVQIIEAKRELMLQHGTLGTLQDIIIAQDGLEEALMKYTSDDINKLRIDQSVIPNTVEWSAAIPVEPAQEEIDRCRKVIASWNKAVAFDKNNKEIKERLLKELLGGDDEPEGEATDEEPKKKKDKDKLKDVLKDLLGG